MPMPVVLFILFCVVAVLVVLMLVRENLRQLTLIYDQKVKISELRGEVTSLKRMLVFRTEQARIRRGGLTPIAPRYN